MGDARHKNKRDHGDRREMTPEWKQIVRDRLVGNRQTGTYPRNQVELAEAVGASDKSAITKMFAATSSAFVPAVCRVLKIPLPLENRIAPDEIERFVAKLAGEERQRANAALRLMFPWIRADD